MTAINDGSHVRSHDHEVRQDFSKLRAQLLILGLFRFSEALAWTSIFPYAYFMVQSFGGGSKANPALLVGLLIAVFTFSEFISATIWAKVSESIGRKWTLLIGVFGAMASAFFFGLSRSIYVAVAIRAFGGLANPNVGVVQTCVGEIVKDKGHLAKAFSIVPFLRGLGSVIGPVIGGTLAEPAKRFPSIFRPDSFWDLNPFFLPNLVVTTILATTWLVGFLFLKETHPSFAHQSDVGREAVFTLGNMLNITKSLKSKFKYAAVQDNEEDTGRTRSPLSTRLNVPDGEVELENLESSNEEVGDGAVSQSSDTLQKPYTTQIVLQILSVSLLAFHKVASDTLMPVFLASSSSESEDDRIAIRSFSLSGGFGMDTISIGNILLTQAIVAIIAQLAVVPIIIERFGVLRVYRWTLFVFPWIYCFTPFVVKLRMPFSVIVLLLDLWIKVLLFALGYVCSAILTTSTLPSTDHLAMVNGASAAFSCLGRSIGPLTIGPLFDWSSKRGSAWLPFWLMSGVSAIGALEAWMLRDHP